MENASDALKIGFALVVFVIALSIAFQGIALARETSDMVMYSIDRTNFYPKYKEVVLSSKKLELRRVFDDDTQTEDSIIVTNDERRSRIVRADTVISNLYKYYSTSFAIIIQKSDGSTIAKFDSMTELAPMWTAGKSSGIQPWTKVSDNWGDRVNLFLTGTKTTTKTYPGGNKAGFGKRLENGKNNKGEWVIAEEPFVAYKDKEFIEEFVEVTLGGETVQGSDGSSIVINPGAKKVFIYYTVID